MKKVPFNVQHVDARLLHSRYDPKAEARRFIDALELKEGILFFILIEPGLGYLIPPLRCKVPNARIISLHVEKPSGSNGEIVPENAPDASWNPEDEISLQHFLESQIPDTKAGAIKIVEWRPGLNVFGEAYLKLLSEAAEFIKRADANYRTSGAFGRRWFRNFFRNLLIISECAYPVVSELPIVVTGAGPSLEKIIPVLREKKQSYPFMLIAVSSSAAALRAGGIVPDAVISTDGGGWALFHLAEYYRSGYSTGGDFFLAAVMNAALISQAGKNPVLIISDGSLWQKIILEGLGIPFIVLPQRGTVSAAALDLAFCLSTGKIYLSGVDLSHSGLLTHARPYSFDHLWEKKQNRFNPLYAQAFSRSSAIKEGGSHNIYASWFSRQIDSYPKRLFSLGKNNPVFKDLSVSSLDFHTAHKKEPAFKTVKLNPNENRSAAGAELLVAALEEPDLSGKIAGEIGPLLCPGEKVSLEKLKAEASALIKTYRRVSCG